MKKSTKEEIGMEGNSRGKSKLISEDHGDIFELQISACQLSKTPRGEGGVTK